MSDPAYQEFSAEAIPEVRHAGTRVRILLGEYNGQRGVIEDPNTAVQYLDVALDAGHVFSHTLPAQDSAFIYVFEGEASLGGTALPQHSLAVLTAGETLELRGGAAGARFILVSGKPLREPIVQYGPFVMNTREEIEQAMQDYRDNALVRKKAAMRGDYP
jgi:redox-sensitive bicupin YhaK (pirin superfamily)